MARRPLHIGITIGLQNPAESLWLNGIKQNALYLAKLFRNSPLGHRATLLNTTSVALDDVPWDRGQFETVPFEEGWQGLDVLIELGGQIDPEQTARLQRQGTKVVSYCCGPEYAQNIEAMIFGRTMYHSIFINQHYDSVWVIPQIWDLNRGFFETLRRRPVQAVPFVWDPMAIEAATQAMPHRGEYQPGPGPKWLTVIEPNIDVLKFALYPIFIAERAFRQAPDLVQYLHVTNAEQLARGSSEFVCLMNHLDMVREGRASFIGRVTTPYFLAEYTDVVISHQWGLPLNYLYLECCWQGYPLVHNAHLVKDLGYYYEEHDLTAGTNALLHALRHHDGEWQAYRERQRARISRFLADDPGLIARYDDLLIGLVDGEGA